MEIDAIIFFIVFLGAVGYWIYGMLRHGGIKGEMMGAPVKETLGEVELPRRHAVARTLRVHTLSRLGYAGAELGLEISANSIGSWGMDAIPLTCHEARTLELLLARAREHVQSGKAPAEASKTD